MLAGRQAHPYWGVTAAAVERVVPQTTNTVDLMIHKEREWRTILVYHCVLHTETERWLFEDGLALASTTCNNKCDIFVRFSRRVRVPAVPIVPTLGVQQQHAPGGVKKKNAPGWCVYVYAATTRTHAPPGTFGLFAPGRFYFLWDDRPSTFVIAPGRFFHLKMV